LGAAFTEAGACTGLGGGGDDSDEQLVLRVQFGDGEALALLRARYCGLLQSQALRLLRSPEEADDVVSEVFIEVWQRASCYHREWARAVAWLITLVRRRAIDRLRVRQRQRKIEAGLSQKQLSCAPDGGSPVEEEMRLGEIRAVLESALSRLPEEQGRAVWMAYYKGFSQKEISKITKAPVGTVKTRLEIGLRKMRQRLSRDESVLNALRGAGTGRASPRARSATGGRLEAEELARGGEDHAGCEGTAEGGDSAGEVR
jgi:RNA polymerase sigma-70 factor (ECF subfamily)